MRAFIAILPILALCSCAYDSNSPDQKLTPQSSTASSGTEQSPEKEMPTEPSNTGQTQTRKGSGALTSLDGITEGRFNVELITGRDGYANIEFSDLVLPDAKVHAGGALEPRGDDRCFDLGIKASGGNLVHNSVGGAKTTMPSGFKGHELYEVILYTSFPLDEIDSAPCYNLVIARGMIDWE